MLSQLKYFWDLISKSANIIFTNGRLGRTLNISMAVGFPCQFSCNNPPRPTHSRPDISGRDSCSSRRNGHQSDSRWSRASSKELAVSRQYYWTTNFHGISQKLEMSLKWDVNLVADLGINDSLGRPPLQLTLPPVVHPDLHQELRLLPRLVRAGHQAVVTGWEARSHSHLTVYFLSRSNWSPLSTSQCFVVVTRSCISINL